MNQSNKHNKSYNDYSSWIKKKFNSRIQKISVDAGFTCPNRDGTKGLGGCIYCDNTTFSPAYCNPVKKITEQLNEGIAFFSNKYPTQRYIAYFQSFSNTYSDIGTLEKLYKEALSHPDVIGISVSTRPDCIDNGSLELLAELSKKYFVTIEFGIESTSDKTLALINRCHTFIDSVNAIKKAVSCNLNTGAHMILGLPGESREQIIEHSKQISQLPISFLKMHQLQVIKGTSLAELYIHNPTLFTIYSIDEYIDLTIEFLENLSPEIIIERFTSESPREKVIAPNWNGLKNFEIIEKIRKRMAELNTWQGKYCSLF